MSDFIDEPLDDEEDFDGCEHGVGFDHECAACERESEACGYRDVFDAGGEQ